MTTFMVEVTPPEPGEERDEEADAAFEREALWRALQDALDRQKLGGAFRVLGPLPENPCGEVPLEPAGMVPPPDQLKAFFAELRATAQDSLTLLRIMGVPSNAKVVEVWRKFASYQGSDDDLDKAIEDKAGKLEALDEVLREVSGALNAAQSVERDLDDVIEKAEKAVQNARR